MDKYISPYSFTMKMVLPLMDNDTKYNISNIVATYKSYKIAADKTLSANKNTPTDFELFIPYSELPVALELK